MEDDDKKKHTVPANVEDAVVEFSRARQDRILIRRARITEKLQAVKNAEAEIKGDVASVPSSLEFLIGMDDKATPPSRPDGTGGDRSKGGRGRKQHAKEKEVKKAHVAVDQLDLQIEESRKQLEQVILDGNVLITNVKVAAEYREKVRQQKQDESHKERLERLKQEAEESQVMYDALSKNWNMKAEKALPMDLYKQMKAQQDACDELLAKKDDLIISMRREIEENDFEYEGSLEKYQKDSMLMGDRIDDLVDDLRTAFIEELTLIEDYTCQNGEVILEENQNEWMDLLQSFEQMEKNNLEERKADAVARFQILNDLFIMTKQEARQLRHKMEDDLRILIQEGEQIKYACHINLEKMAYNLHILQCRSKENVELKNMMKRFLLKLHDKFDTRAANLKRKMELGRRYTEKLYKEIQRLESQVSTFSEKTLHLAMSDHRKFMDLWEANEDLIRDKVKGLLDSDKFVFETQLGVEFPTPSLETFDFRPTEVQKKFQREDRTKTTKNLKKKTGTGMKSGNSSGSGSGDEDNNHKENVEDTKAQQSGEPKIACTGNASLMIMKTNSLEFLPGPEPDPAIQRRLMIGITRVVCDQSGFIVEEELQKILEPLLETEKNLVNLDAVLQALGINNVEEMQSLSRYMLRYCKVMKGVMSKMGSDWSAGMNEMNVSLDGIIGRTALLALGNETTASEPSLNNVSSVTNSDSIECKVDPEKYCECKSAKDQEKKIAEEAKNNKKANRKQRSNNKKEVAKKEDEDDTMSIASTVQNVEMEVCDVICCTPLSSQHSIEEALNDIETDRQLQDALNEAEYDGKGAEEGDDIGTQLKPDCSFISNKATVLSWLDSVDRGNVFENLSQYHEHEHLGEDRDEYIQEEFEAVLRQARLHEDEESKVETVDIATATSDITSEPGALASNQNSKTISIHSFDSFSDTSQDFLFIDPQDVVTALKSFIEEYNNRQKVVLLTQEEIIAMKLEKIKYPSLKEVADYWENVTKLLNPKGKDLWDTVQYCFDEYNKILKERNEFVEEIERFYKQNYELSHLLQKHLQSGRKAYSGYPPIGSLDPGNMGYC